MTKPATVPQLIPLRTAAQRLKITQADVLDLCEVQKVTVLRHPGLVSFAQVGLLAGIEIDHSESVVCRFAGREKHEAFARVDVWLRMNQLVRPERSELFGRASASGDLPQPALSNTEYYGAIAAPAATPKKPGHRAHGGGKTTRQRHTPELTFHRKRHVTTVR